MTQLNRCASFVPVLSSVEEFRIQIYKTTLGDRIAKAATKGMLKGHILFRAFNAKKALF